MQQPDEIISLKRSRLKQSVKLHHFSSFGILNRNGLEMLKGSNVPVKEEEDENMPPKFPRSSMPEQPSGYIKCKEHDFL